MDLKLYYPPQVATPADLPHLGLCPACEQEIRIRKNGTLHRHTAPAPARDQCSGSGRAPAAVLPATFGRWLTAQKRRKDHRSNPLTRLAQHVLGEPGGCGDETHADVDWKTPDELHREMHSRDLRRGGEGGPACDWACGYLKQVREAYDRLTNA